MVYDRAEWHEEAAASGRPFAHGELYLRWLERRDLLVGTPPPDELNADAMTDEGRRFTDTYYGRYLDDYSAVFAGRPPYSVDADEAAFERLAPVIDQRYAEWVYAGRPELPPEADPADALASLLDEADVPPDLTAETVRSMPPDQVVVALERLLVQRRHPDGRA